MFTYARDMMIINIIFQWTDLQCAINSVKEISGLTINIFMRVAPLLEKKDQNELQVQTYNGMHMIQDKPTEHSRTTILKCYLTNLVCFVIQWKYVSPWFLKIVSGEDIDFWDIRQYLHNKNITYMYSITFYGIQRHSLTRWERWRNDNSGYRK